MVMSLAGVHATGSSVQNVQFASTAEIPDQSCASLTSLTGLGEETSKTTGDTAASATKASSTATSQRTKESSCAAPTMNAVSMCSVEIVRKT